MVTYIVVNEKARAEFEKRWQIPYGYGSSSCKITNSMDKALGYLEEIKSSLFVEEFCIERCECGFCEVVFEGRWLKEKKERKGISIALYDYWKSKGLEEGLKPQQCSEKQTR